MSRICGFLFCIFFSVAFCQDDSQDLIIQGVILVDHPDHLIKGDLDSYHGIYIEDLCLPGNSRELCRILQASLIGQPLCKETILCAEERIVQFYHDNSHPLVLVFTPEQVVTSGVIQFVVLESRIGTICYEGNCWFSDALLSQCLRLQECGFYNADYAQEDLLWLNRSPFRDTYLILNPGEEPGTTDITVCTKDRFPYQIFVGGDNTGIRTTGEYRLFTGINMGNLFGLDQSLSYQYTVSTDWGRFYAHSGVYKIPLPWRNILEFFGGYSGIRAIMPLDVMTHKGRAWQASMRYLVPLTPHQEYSHEFRFGADYKYTDVNLTFNGIPILGNQAVITQLVLGYSGAYASPVFRTSFNMSFFISPGDIFPHQGVSAYTSLRPSARSNYVYFRFTSTPIVHLPCRWDLVTRFDFQVANRNLLSSEQFGLGGLYTIRGYDERILNTDNAVLLSGEIRTPSIKFLTRQKQCGPDFIEQFQFLAFVDYGFGTDHKPLPGIQNYRYLLSTGVGIFYYVNRHLNLIADWGYPIHRKIEEGVRQKHSRFNFSGTLTF